MGTVLNRKAYFIGFSIIFLIAFFADFNPANLLKSAIVLLPVTVSVVRSMACFPKAAKVRD